LIRQFVAAVSFLTRIPVPPAEQTVQELGRSARWFPLVGLALGGFYAGAAWLLAPHLPALVVAVLLAGMDAVITGALHLDGLADMADGFGAGRTREDVLRIMRDHAVGSYGSAALIILLLLKVACLSQLIANKRYLWILLVAPALSRWAIVLMMQLAPYARQTTTEIGSGALSTHIRRTELVIASATCIALPFAFGLVRTLACWGVAAGTTLVMTAYCRRRIGGVTGDTLGANTVIAEALQFLMALGMSR
jgi:cobalamin 5'-phosphate synthase/cobalamin synthase